MKDLCLLICQSFEKETKAIAKEFENIDVIQYQAKCNYPHIKQNFDEALINKYKKVVVVGGCTIDKSNLQEGIDLYKSESCFYMFTSKSLIDYHIQNGAYIITPGWLSNWENFVTKNWGFDKNTAVEFYKEFCKKLLLLDTGIDEDALKYLKEFSAFVQQPYEVLPVGLDHFRLHIKDIINQVTIKKKSEQLQSAVKNSADNTMAFDLISTLNQKLNEKEIIDNIIEIFRMLFAPKTLFYLSIVDSKLKS